MFCFGEQPVTFDFHTSEFCRISVDRYTMKAKESDFHFTKRIVDELIKQ